MRKVISEIYTVLIKDPEDDIKFDNTFPPTNRKRFAIHIKEEKILELINILSIKKDSTDISYNNDSMKVISIHTGIKKNFNVKYSIKFFSYTKDNGLRLLLISNTLGIADYNVTIGYIYINKLIDKITKKIQLINDNKERTVKITKSIIKNEVDLDKHKYAPLVNDMDKLIDLINKFGIVYHVQKVNKRMTNMIDKFKYKCFSNMEFYLQSNPEELFKYDMITIKPYKSFGIHLNFKYGKENYKILIDGETVETIKSRLDRYDKKGLKI